MLPEKHAEETLGVSRTARTPAYPRRRLGPLEPQPARDRGGSSSERGYSRRRVPRRPASAKSKARPSGPVPLSTTEEHAQPPRRCVPPPSSSSSSSSSPEASSSSPEASSSSPVASSSSAASSSSPEASQLLAVTEPDLLLHTSDTSAQCPPRSSNPSPWHPAS